MRILDANPLIYSVDSSAEHHTTSRAWLDAAMSSSETLLLPWLSALAFVRISTDGRVNRRPLDPATAIGIVGTWLDRPNVTVPEPDPRHLVRMDELLRAAGGRGGNLVNDAHLAALALQWGASVVTFDSDFARFPGVRWERPA